MVLWRRRRRVPYAAVSDEERMSRYVYLLNTLPASVIERAHESAFKQLSRQRRGEMFEKLRPFMSEEEQARQPEPTLLASVLRRTSASGGAAATAVLEDERPRGRGRRPDRTSTVWPYDDPVLAALVANHFLTSSVLISYYSVGAGSLALDGEPAWVGEMGGVQSDPYAGGVFGGVFDGGGGSYGGFDGGGFGGGGFDGGGGGGGDGGGGGG